MGLVTNMEKNCWVFYFKSPWRCHYDPFFQVVVMTMYFLSPTHLDSREYVVMATLLNGMINVLFSMNEILLFLPVGWTEGIGQRWLCNSLTSSLRPTGLSRVYPHIDGHHPIPLPLFLLDEVEVRVFGRGVSEAGGGRDRDLTVIPISVELERIQDVLSIGIHKIRPGLPQWMDNVVDETNLQKTTWMLLSSFIINQKSKTFF